MMGPMTAPSEPRDPGPASPPVDPGAEPAWSPDGVYLTLIRWMLSLTPLERLLLLQDSVRSILRVRGEKTHS